MDHDTFDSEMLDDSDAPSDSEMSDDSDVNHILEREAWLRSFGMTPYTAPGNYDMSMVETKRFEIQERENVHGTLYVSRNDLANTDARYSR